jgi:hypothetical protein
MKNDPPKYLKKLEDCWRSKKKARWSWNSEVPRPKGLRGHDLCFELLRLFAQWDDKRFEAAYDALIEHRVVDENWHFTDRETDGVRAYDRKNDVLQVKAVRSLIRSGRSESRACLEVAAAYGRPAASLTAAAAQLKNLARKT